MTDAIAAERAAQAALPPPTTDAERLVRMGRLDQVARAGMQRMSFYAMQPDVRRAALDAVGVEIAAVDRANQTALLAMLSAEGWFARDVYGEEASQAAFLIIQHAKPDLWRRFVPVLERFAREGRIDGQHFALMQDRLLVSEGAGQRYGSQIVCRAGRLVPATIEDPDRVDARRAEFGLGPLEAYVAQFADRAC